MSRQNVERVARLFSEGVPGLYLMMIGATEDFVWDTTKFDGWPEPREFSGVAGFVEFMEAWVEPYDEWRIEVDEILDAGGDRVVALLRQLGRVRRSKSQVEMRYGVVYSLRDGRVSRAVPYATPEQALEAAGLSD
jgi:ketosteroid isomerase-like protein